MQKLKKPGKKLQIQRQSRIMMQKLRKPGELRKPGKKVQIYKQNSMTTQKTGKIPRTSLYQTQKLKKG
ncbi:hypothetical protein MTHERMMSTA1_24010 [Methanosarcina thermophila MST-A1]|nr:hypothetical protein MTHERMMSTA1_24010 [Methanosarcina thermophila MST-A1]